VVCRIPEKELLIAFKVHSARRADIRDVIMLSEDANYEKVLKHLRKGKKEALKEQINKITDAFEDKNLIDSLKGVFTLSGDVKKQIENTRKNIDDISKRI
jgi:chloramphenicol 3-O-phosphotransferase